MADAEDALRHGAPEARTLYSAARIWAQAAVAAQKESRARSRLELPDVKRYQERALALLGQALDQTPPNRRLKFWREIVQTDPAFALVRRSPEFARLGEKHAPPSTVTEPN